MSIFFSLTLGDALTAGPLADERAHVVRVEAPPANADHRLDRDLRRRRYAKHLALKLGLENKKKSLIMPRFFLGKVCFPPVLIIPYLTERVSSPLPKQVGVAPDGNAGELLGLLGLLQRWLGLLLPRELVEQELLAAVELGQLGLGLS